MTDIRAILFDKDGTLIDVNRTWIPLYKEMLAEEHKLDADGVNHLMEKAGYDVKANVFKSGSILAGGTTRQLVEIWWEGASSAELDRIARRIDNDYAPRARDFLAPLMPLAPLLEELKDDGYVLGIGTNDSVVSATGQFASIGVEHFFSTIIGYDSVAIPKPSGQMIEAFAKHTGFHTSNIAMVGDNTHDLEEGHHGRAGLSIGVLTGNGRLEDLAPLAHHVLPSVSELRQLLTAL